MARGSVKSIPRNPSCLHLSIINSVAILIDRTTTTRSRLAHIVYIIDFAEHQRPPRPGDERGLPVSM